jgi:hypothetical protein
LKNTEIHSPDFKATFSAVNVMLKYFKNEFGYIHMYWAIVSQIPLVVCKPFLPDKVAPNKLVEMVGAQDGPVPGEVIEVVHDDGDEEVEDEEGADDEEGDEVGVGEVGAAARRIA